MIDPELGAAGLDEFAGAVAATDLLVTVDTMAVHLAGAIGHLALDQSMRVGVRHENTA